MISLFDEAGADIVPLHQIQNGIEVAEIPLQLDVVLARLQDAVVTPFDEDLTRSCGAGLQVPSDVNIRFHGIAGPVPVQLD